MERCEWEGEAVLFIGDDCAEDHHDIELVGDEGRVPVELLASVAPVSHAQTSSGPVTARVRA